MNHVESQRKAHFLPKAFFSHLLLYRSQEAVGDAKTQRKNSICSLDGDLHILNHFMM